MKIESLPNFVNAEYCENERLQNCIDVIGTFGILLENEFRLRRFRVTTPRYHIEF